jgi:hypothetical protein
MRWIFGEFLEGLNLAGWPIGGVLPDEVEYVLGFLEKPPTDPKRALRTSRPRVAETPPREVVREIDLVRLMKPGN